MKLSARNQLRGRVKSIVHGAINSEVVIEIAPGIEIHAQITTAAVHELKLREGTAAYAVIKTDNVMVGVED